MKQLLVCAAALSISTAAWAAAPLGSAYDELRRELGYVAGDTTTVLRLGASLSAASRAGSPDPELLRKLDAQCGDKAGFRRTLARALVEETREPVVPKASSDQRADPYWGRNGRYVVAENFKQVLPRQLQTIAEKLPAPGAARFLRDGETLKGRPRDLAGAVRQRAEWLVVLEALISDVDRQRLAAPGEFQPVYVLGVWSTLKCDLSRNSVRLVERQLAGSGYPSAAALGVDTEDAFLFLVARARDPALADRTLGFARAAGADQTVIDALTRWSSPAT